MNAESTGTPAGRPETSAVSASPCDSPAVEKRNIAGTILLSLDAYNFDLGILLVPIGGDVLECQAKRARLTGFERRLVEVDCVRISRALLRHHERHSIVAHDFAH